MLQGGLVNGVVIWVHNIFPTEETGLDLYTKFECDKITRATSNLRGTEVLRITKLAVTKRDKAPSMVSNSSSPSRAMKEPCDRNFGFSIGDTDQEEIL